MNNAIAIGPNKFNEIIEKASRYGFKLENFIVNLPEEKEKFMRTRILDGIKQS